MRRDKRPRDYRYAKPHRCDWCAPGARLRAILRDRRCREELD